MKEVYKIGCMQNNGSIRWYQNGHMKIPYPTYSSFRGKTWKQLWRVRDALGMAEHLAEEYANALNLDNPKNVCVYAVRGDEVEPINGFYKPKKEKQ